MDNLDLTILRALARLSRMRKAVDCESLALRAGGSLEGVRGALGRLSRAQLVDRSGDGSQIALTMMGLAVAVASGEAGAARSATRRRAATAKRRAA